MADGRLAPFRLRPWFCPRPWGRRDLQPWYSPEQVGTTEPVGEAWLTGPDSSLETGTAAGRTLSSVAAAQSAALMGQGTQESEFPLLVKLLFPADKLSVQVHPDDAHAQRMGQPRAAPVPGFAEAQERRFAAPAMAPPATASPAPGSQHGLLDEVTGSYFGPVADQIVTDASGRR